MRCSNTPDSFCCVFDRADLDLMEDKLDSIDAFKLKELSDGEFMLIPHDEGSGLTKYPSARDSMQVRFSRGRPARYDRTFWAMGIPHMYTITHEGIRFKPDQSVQYQKKPTRPMPHSPELPLQTADVNGHAETIDYLSVAHHAAETLNKVAATGMVRIFVRNNQVKVSII